jgi:hypothetical protein
MVLGQVAAPGLLVHDYCEAGELTITAVGEVPEDAEDAQWFSLTISSRAGGSVTVPGEDAFTYRAGAVIDLVATAEPGYEFVNWTGDVETIANDDAAETTIIIDGNYSVVASFREEMSEKVIGPTASQTPLWALIPAIAVIAAGLVIFSLRRRRTTKPVRS